MCTAGQSLFCTLCHLCTSAVHTGPCVMFGTSSVASRSMHIRQGTAVDMFQHVYLHCNIAWHIAAAVSNRYQTAVSKCGKQAFDMQAGWGKCNEAFMSGYCLQSCNRCASTPAVPVSTCSDIPPNSQYTCAQQVSYGVAAYISVYFPRMQCCSETAWL